MAEVKKARLFLRRGTDTDRIATVLCEGELGYSTDAFRVVVGDGAIAGGRSLGATVFVSGGDYEHNFHTSLTAAANGGLALSGDFAVFPAASYTHNNAASGTIVPGPSATTVMLLTGSNPATGSHWVSINSGIPFNNLTILDDDISGDKVHGGVISGPITLSGGNINIGGNSTSENLILSGVALSAQRADLLIDTEDVIYPLGITSTSQVTALSGIDQFSAKTSSAGGTVITATQYFEKQQLISQLQSVYVAASDGSIEPSTSDGDWTTQSIQAALIAASVSLPVAFPKVAILSVYHYEKIPNVKRIPYALYSSHATASFGGTGKWYLQGRWDPGEDAGGGSEHFSWGSVIFARMSSLDFNIHLLHAEHTSTSYTNPLTVDLIGVQY